MTDTFTQPAHDPDAEMTVKRVVWDGIHAKLNTATFQLERVRARLKETEADLRGANDDRLQFLKMNEGLVERVRETEAERDRLRVGLEERCEWWECACCGLYIVVRGKASPEQHAYPQCLNVKCDDPGVFYPVPLASRTKDGEKGEGG